MDTIGYINEIFDDSPENIENYLKKEMSKIERISIRRIAVHRERTRSIQLLKKIITELENTKIYLFSILSLGHSVQEITNSLKQLKHLTNDYLLYFAKEKYILSKDSMESFICLMDSISFPPQKGKGKPKGSFKVFDKYGRYHSMIENKQITISQVARELNVTRKTVYQYRRAYCTKD